MSKGAQNAEWLAAARLVRRTGFGATGAEVDATLAAGPAAVENAVLTAGPGEDPGAAATPPPVFETIENTGKQADQSQRRAGPRQSRVLAGQQGCDGSL